jgi:hypothetical protein
MSTPLPPFFDALARFTHQTLGSAFALKESLESYVIEVCARWCQTAGLASRADLAVLEEQLSQTHQRVLSLEERLEALERVCFK